MSMAHYPRRVLVANRGEIARRVISTARRLGVESIAVCHPVDADLPYVREADFAIPLHGDPPVRSYLDGSQIIERALEIGATAIHPGYGFLAENAEFASDVASAGLLWVGPPAAVIRQMGDKVEARKLVAARGVPVSGGANDALDSVDAAVAQAAHIGYPVMLKAAAGGGGIGMTVAADAQALRKAFAGTKSMAERSFGSDRVFVERFIPTARHIEVQVLGLADGRILTLGERDCSVQRRHQKIVEETPAYGLDDAVRDRLRQSAVAAASAVGYLNAGTVEFLLDSRTDEYVFLEMNTRIQVEHPITELAFGIDLVEQQLSIAQTGTVSPDFAPIPRGHAIELRVCAEDPQRFFPSPGDISGWSEPRGEGIRVDAGYQLGNAVTPYFDPLLAKLCTWGMTRDEAIARAASAIDDFEIAGLITNLPFLKELVGSREFGSGRYDTNIVNNVKNSSNVRG
jgi:acetyl-CoA carboxylase biotin carboxylase subunit